MTVSARSRRGARNELGALDFLTKPVDHEVLLQLVDKSQQYRSSRLEPRPPVRPGSAGSRWEPIAESERLPPHDLGRGRRRALGHQQRAQSPARAGTGKNVVARLHPRGRRRDGPAAARGQSRHPSSCGEASCWPCPAARLHRFAGPRIGDLRARRRRHGGARRDRRAQAGAAVQAVQLP